MMKLYLSLVCLVFSMLIAGCNHKIEKTSEARYAFGVMEYDITDTYGHGDVAGKRSYGKIKKIRSGSNIRIKQGMTFGIQYSLPKIIDGQEVLIQEIVEFPNGGLTNPNTNINSRRVTTERIEYQNELDELTHVAYILDEPWEMKKGKWTFSVYIDNQIYIEHEFLLY